MKFVGVFLLSVACAVMARAFDMDTLLKECSVERTGPGSRTAVQAHPSLQTVCKQRKYGGTLSAGGSHTCALSADGSYECIGSDKYGQSNGKKPKWPLSNPDGKKKDGAKYVQVSAGTAHTCAVTADGSYECIGFNGDGRSNRHKPVYFDRCPVGFGNDGRWCHTCDVDEFAKGGSDSQCESVLRDRIPVRRKTDAFSLSSRKKSNA